MALPIKPKSGITTPPLRKPIIEPIDDQEDPFALPDLSASEPKPAPKARSARVSSPKKQKPAPEFIEKTYENISESDNTLEDGWVIDEETGLPYKQMPKSVYKGKGAKAVPVLLIPEFDADNMTGEAETYLKHLRVPPDKEEQARLRELKARQRRDQESSYAAIHAEALEEKSPLEDDEPETKKSKFNILNWFR